MRMLIEGRVCWIDKAILGIASSSQKQKGYLLTFSVGKDLEKI